jgi:ribosomal protein L11 methyltransferase
MSWVEVAVTVPRPLAETALAVLLEFFPQGLAEADEAGAVTYRGYLTAVPTTAWLREVEARTGASAIGVERLVESDFTARYRARFGRLELSPGFAVAASKRTAEDGDLLLTPGLAFGTGDHASTRLALAGMMPALRPQRAVADVGTGTGILALFARRQGAEPVFAYDVDPVAVVAARRHARRNHLTLRVRQGTIDPRHGPFALIVANIAADVLVALAPRLVAGLAADGQLVLSGILAPRLGEVLASYEALRPLWSGREGEWVAVRLGKE